MEVIMTKFIITTESGSDLPKEIIDRYNIYVIPMHVTMGDQTYDDGKFDVEKVFNYYEEHEVLPKTSGTTPQDNTKVIQQTFNAANIAAADVKDIHSVDAKHVSMRLTAIIKATAQFIENHPDITPEEIIAFVEEVRERTRMVFLPKTLLYLRAGGRVSNLAFH